MSRRMYIVRCIVSVLAFLLVLALAVMLNEAHAEPNPSEVIDVVDIDNSDLKIDWDYFARYDIELSENLKIATSGTYYLTGSLINQNIIIDAPNSKVRLILDNVAVKNESGPAIVSYSADDLIIELVGENILEDGANYSSDYEWDVNGVIYAKNDLTFQGNGKLKIIANHKDGIASKDDLKFNSGNYDINAVDDGIRGHDSVYIVDGDFNINAKYDAIKSTNEIEADKGFVLIKNGNLCITSGINGIKTNRQRIVSEKVNFCQI